MSENSIKHIVSMAPADIATVIGVVLTLLSVVGIGLGIGSATNPDLSSDTGSRQVWDWDSRKGLENETPLRWNSHEVIGGGEKVRVFFNIGTPSCYGIRSEVTESRTAVTISLFEGSLPDAPEQCSLVGTSASTVVELARPLSGRLVLHGN
ncbi:hypothetical protein NXS13_02930 [Corynebacterium sp. ES2730-CONJ]|uniref:hypothetical protein n=1 Tax=Corynebacterium sp. ES2730-CONJ TaxID=2973941 RepID=UPI00216B26BA|nr:hypothetical protein [Corynebacterium sp. ES2730-CONJ]MCS4531461.1 hypothetical protein [Corynebacterium sp. ES2730-CONJ]